ncbi:hypothetical protein AAE478_010383 [Parahypoxylon ruwenzoriense]
MAKPQAKPDLAELGARLLRNGPVKTLPTTRRVRILFNGAYVADTTSALYVWEHEYYPYYYVPADSFVEGALVEPSDTGTAPYWVSTLHIGGRSTDRVLVFGDKDKLRGGATKLARLVRVEFGAADAWFEEDTPIYVHPKDPFRRVDVLHSSRPLEVRVGGVLVAQTNSSFHLHETGLPCRYYVPATAVDRGILRESDTTTACPYKGVANYYHVEVAHGPPGEEGERKETIKDLVWYYRTPTLECALIAGCLCFYHEKDGVSIALDGKTLPRPETPWS